MNKDIDFQPPLPPLSDEALKIFYRHPAAEFRVTTEMRARPSRTRRTYGPAIRRAAARWNIPAAKVFR
jgi:hypothetical protein